MVKQRRATAAPDSGRWHAAVAERLADGGQHRAQHLAASVVADGLLSTQQCFDRDSTPLREVVQFLQARGDLVTLAGAGPTLTARLADGVTPERLRTALAEPAPAPADTLAVPPVTMPPTAVLRPPTTAAEVLARVLQPPATTPGTGGTPALTDPYTAANVLARRPGLARACAAPTAHELAAVAAAYNELDQAFPRPRRPPNGRLTDTIVAPMPIRLLGLADLEVQVNRLGRDDKIADMVADFAPASLGEILVAVGADGHAGIVDGARRRAAILQCIKHHGRDYLVSCRLYHSFGTSHDAEMMRRTNNKLGFAKIQDWVVKLAAGDTEATAIRAAVAAAPPFTLAERANRAPAGFRLGCFDTMAVIVARGGADQLTESLRILAKAFPDGPKALSRHDLVGGVGLFLVFARSKVNTDHLVKRLVKVGIDGLLVQAKGQHRNLFAGVKRHQGSLAVASAIETQYNTHLHEHGRIRKVSSVQFYGNKVGL